MGREAGRGKGAAGRPIWTSEYRIMPSSSTAIQELLQLRLKLHPLRQSLCDASSTIHPQPSTASFLRVLGVFVVGFFLRLLVQIFRAQRAHPDVPERAGGLVGREPQRLTGDHLVAYGDLAVFRVGVHDLL